MTVKLTQGDFRRLVDLVQGLPDFSGGRDRRRLVAAALEGSPRAGTILAGLDLGGTPRGAAVEVVKSLADFGQVAYGKEALGVFLSYLQGITGEEQAEFVASLFATYPMNDAGAARNRPIDRWRGTESAEDVREKIIGENTLRDISMLEMALEAARAVVRVGLPDGAGSGFMIAPDLLMTNHHVIASREEAAGAEFMFDYQLDRSGKAREPVTVSAAPTDVFRTDEPLDYTVVQVAGPPDFGAALTLRPAVLRRDERVSIIQHPGGHFKKISMQNNFVAYADRQVVQYYTSTLPGSSGSPVFNDAFEVIAIHHSGGMLEEPGTERRYLRNAGSSMVAVLEDLKQNAPEIYARLKA
jgi:V8-like Glu-specific endopeptidase